MGWFLSGRPTTDGADRFERFLTCVSKLFFVQLRTPVHLGVKGEVVKLPFHYSFGFLS